MTRWKWPGWAIGWPALFPYLPTGMSGSSRSGVLKVCGGVVTVVFAFVLIGAGVQLARNAEGYKVKTAALEEVAGAPVTVIDDEPSAAPPPPVLATADAETPPSAPSGATPPPTTPTPGPTDGGDGGGDDDDPTPELPPELDPIVGLVDDIAGATSETLGGATATDSNPVDGATQTVDQATADLGL